MADEFIDSTPSSNVDLPRFTVYDVHVRENVFSNEKVRYAAADSVQLDASTNVTSADAYSLTLTLSESQRVALIALSGTPGGDTKMTDFQDPVFALPYTDVSSYYYYDTGPVVLDVTAGGVRDVAQNDNEIISICDWDDPRSDQGNLPLQCDRVGLELTEFADIVVPALVSAVIDFGLAEVRLTASETVDATPASKIDLTKFFLANTADGRDVALASASVVETDGVTFTIKITESLRIDGIRISGVPGGDGGGMFVRVEAGGLSDVALNEISDSVLPPEAITEIEDLIGPVVTKAKIFFGNGTLIITAQETMNFKNASLFNASQVFISDVAGDYQISLNGSSFVPGESPSITLQLTEAQRVQAIAISGTSGGDGSAAVIDVRAGTFRDLAGNLNAAQEGATLTEIADTTRPKFVDAVLNYGTGLLTLTATETIDVTPASLVNGTAIVISRKN